MIRLLRRRDITGNVVLSADLLAHGALSRLHLGWTPTEVRAWTLAPRQIRRHGALAALSVAAVVGGAK